MSDDYPKGIYPNYQADNGLLSKPNDYKNDDIDAPSPANNYQNKSYLYPSNGQNYPYSSNIPGQSNQYNFPPNDNEYPVNPTSQEIMTNQNYLIQNNRSQCLRYLLLVMAILQLIFLILDIIILTVSHDLFTAYLIVDQVGIFCVAIIFLLSFINKFKIHFLVRVVPTVAVWFIGSIIRGIGMAVAAEKNCSEIYFAFLGIRSFLLFFSIPIGAIIRD